MFHYKFISAMYRLRDIQKHRKVIRSLSELDAYFQYVESCMQESSDSGLAALSKIRFDPIRSLPADPYSKAYATMQMELYLQISGRANYVAHEAEKSEFNFDETKNRPYPFFTKSPQQVWEQYAGIGHLIKVLDPKPNSKILEFGSGWGNVALPLAQMGNQVTCVEIDDLMVKLLKYRSEQLQQSITIVQSDMLEFEPNEKFDAVVFYESFHHCLDHVALLKRLPSYLKNGGKVIFAGEPVAMFPYPWGLRLDGLSLWSIRKYGWFELGFSRGYFTNLLRQNGWQVSRYKQKGVHIADAYLTSRLF